MTKEQAETIFWELFSPTIPESREQTEVRLTLSPYPGLYSIYIEYLNNNINPRAYITNSIHYIQVSDTKLYKVMK